MRQDQNHLWSHGVTIGFLVLLGTVASAADLRPSKITLQTGVFRKLQPSGKKNGFVFLDRASTTTNGPLGDEPFLLGDRLRGGAWRGAKKEAKKGEKEEEEKETTTDKEGEEEAEEEEEVDLDKVLESELVEETTTEEAEVDEDDEDEIIEDESEEEEDEYDVEEEEEEEEESAELEESSGYDEPLVQPAMLQLYATFGVMMLSKRLDLYSPIVVRVARFAFIGYLVALQIFLLFVRIQAKTADDRTPVEVTNPLSGILKSQLPGADSNAMMKTLASSFLKSQSTVLEYDLKQAQNMQGGLLFNMGFMWLLHFKMDQIQPLLINTATGLMNMAYSPLFQVYVLGRHLERPFKNPATQKYEDAAKAAAARAEKTTTEEEDGADPTASDTEEDAEEEFFDAEEEEEDNADDLGDNNDDDKAEDAEDEEE